MQIWVVLQYFVRINFYESGIFTYLARAYFRESRKPYFRSSRHEVFCRKGVLTNFAKFTRKYLCQSLFFNKVAGLRLWCRFFPVNFVKFLRTPFPAEHLRATASEYNYTLTTKQHFLRMPI